MSLIPLQFTVATAASYKGTYKQQSGFFLRLVSAPGPVTFRFNGTDEVPYAPGETRRTQGMWKSIEVKCSVVGTVLCVIGTEPGDLETSSPGVIGTSGGGAIFARTRTRGDLVFGAQHGISAAGASTQVQVGPPGSIVTRWYASVDPAAPGPMRVGASFVDVTFGRWVMPGREITGEVTEDAGGTPTLSIYNPQIVGVAYTIQTEYYIP